AGVGGIGLQVDLVHVASAEARVVVAALELPTVLQHVRMHDADRDLALEPLEGAIDQRAVRPRAGIRDVEAIAPRLGRMLGVTAADPLSKRGALPLEPAAVRLGVVPLIDP